MNDTRIILTFARFIVLHFILYKVSVPLFVAYLLFQVMVISYGLWKNPKDFDLDE